RSGLCPRETSMGGMLCSLLPGPGPGVACPLLRGLEQREHLGARLGERERDDRAAVLREHRRIARSLRLDDLGERVRAPGDLEVDIAALGDLHEHTLGRAALV